MSNKTQRDYNNNNDFVELFEQRLCDYTGAPYAVAVDRCTNAILLALELYGKRKQKITLPKQTYLSVPMTLIRYGYNVWLDDISWTGSYQLGYSNVYDYAVGFERNMYVPGQIQCVSFQQKKRLAIGKGGAVLLDNEDQYKLLKRMRHDGRDSSKPVSKESPEDLIMGYHMYMSPDEAARGLLLLNQLQEQYTLGSHTDYPDITTFKCLKEFAL